MFQLLIKVDQKIDNIIVEEYNNGYVNGRNHAFSEAVMCYGADLPIEIDINYPCGE